MAAAWRSAGSVCIRSLGTTPLTVTQPAGHQTGDLLLMIACSFESSASVNINTPSGWTLISANVAWGSTSKFKSAAFYKVAASSSEPSASLTTASSSFLDAQISAFSGVDTTVPIDANTTWVASGASSTSFTVQAITTVTDAALIVYAITDGSGAAYSTPPSGATERSESYISLANFVVATETKTTAGTEAAGTYTKATGDAQGGSGIVVALRPSGGAVAAFVPQITVVN